MARALKCSSCGAPLPATSDAFLTCTHCGQTFERSRIAQAASGDEAGGVGGMVLVAVLGVAVSAAGGIGAMMVAQDSADDTPTPALPSLPALMRSVGAERTLWDSVGGRPALATLQHRTLILGRTRTVSPDDALWLTATDAADGKQVWRAGPFGTYSDGYQHTRYAIVGAVAAMTDFRGQVHLLDLADGAEKKVVTLSDRAEGICVEQGKLRVEQVDDRDVWVDPTTGAVTEAPHGDACERHWDTPKSGVTLSTLPKAPSYEAETAFQTQAGLVSVGRRHPGTGTGKAVGYANGAATWQQWIPAVDPATAQEGFLAAAVNDTRLAVTYGVGTEQTHLTLFDVRDGTRVWDTTLRAIFAVDDADDIVMNNDRILVVRTSSVDIYDVKTGKQVGVIGQDTYDDEL